MLLPRLSDIQAVLFISNISHLSAISVKNITVIWRAAPDVSQYVYLMSNFSANTTDRHWICADDVVAEVCRIIGGFKCKMFSFPYCINCDCLLGWHSKSICFHCTVECLFCFVWLFHVSSPLNMVYMSMSDTLFMCVFMFVHFIDVNWRPRRCSQSHSLAIIWQCDHSYKCTSKWLNST